MRVSNLVKPRFVITLEQHEELRAGNKLTKKTMSFLLRECLGQRLQAVIKENMVATDKKVGGNQRDYDYSKDNEKNNSADSTKNNNKKKEVL